MDPAIVAAIIGAIAAVVAAVIGIVGQRRKVTTRNLNFEKSKALKLGYVLAAIECYLDARKMGIASLTIDTALPIQTERACELANSIGISLGSDPNELVTNLSLTLDGKAIAIKSAFKVGYIMGRVYFYSVSLMAIGSLPPIKTDIDRLGEAEVLLRQAGLPSDFLSPVRKLWKDALSAAENGKFRAIDTQMEDVVDQLCASIEHGK